MSVTGNRKFTKYITNIVWQALINLSIIGVADAKPDPLVVTVLELTKSTYYQSVPILYYILTNMILLSKSID